MPHFSRKFFKNSINKMKNTSIFITNETNIQYAGKNHCKVGGR